MDHVADCVKGNQQPRTQGEEGLADMRVMAKIEESIKGRGVVKV